MKNNSPKGGRPQKPRASSARQNDSASNENRKDFNAKPERPSTGKTPRTSSASPRFKKSDNGFKKSDDGFKKSDSGFNKSEGGFKKSDDGFKRSEGSFKKSEDGFKKPRANASSGKRVFKSDVSDKGPKSNYAGKSDKDGKRPYVRKTFTKDSEASSENSSGEKPVRFRPNDKTYRVRKPSQPKELAPGEKEIKLSSITKGGGLSSRGKKKEYTSNLQKTVIAPEYDFKKMSQISKAKGKSKANDTDIRLNRYISNAGICSRRDADLLIQMGEIKVNGKIVTEMGYQVKQGDEVRYGTKILNREKKVYVLLNKPKDFITTTDDPQERKTVMQLVANAGKERIYPVGRLDRNTTGLLLMTNDGELSVKLAHPTNKIKKIYMVELDKPITPVDFDKVKAGLHLEDGIAQVDDLALIGNTRTFLGIEIHIGRNRIVRRIFESLGYDVKALDRVMYAGLTKKDLPRGTWRYLTEKEVINLKFF